MSNSQRPPIHFDKFTKRRLLAKEERFREGSTQSLGWKGVDTRAVQVAGLDHRHFVNENAAEEFLFKHFARCGRIETFRREVDRKASSRPMYQIGFDDESAAKRALYMNLSSWGPPSAGEIFKVSYRYFTPGHSWLTLTPAQYVLYPLISPSSFQRARTLSMRFPVNVDTRLPMALPNPNWASITAGTTLLGSNPPTAPSSAPSPAPSPSPSSAPSSSASGLSQPRTSRTQPVKHQTHGMAWRGDHHELDHASGRSNVVNTIAAEMRKLDLNAPAIDFDRSAKLQIIPETVEYLVNEQIKYPEAPTIPFLDTPELATGITRVLFQTSIEAIQAAGIDKRLRVLPIDVNIESVNAQSALQRRQDVIQWKGQKNKYERERQKRGLGLSRPPADVWWGPGYQVKEPKFEVDLTDEIHWDAKKWDLSKLAP